MCVIEQWHRVYQDGRRELQEEHHYCPHRFEPGHNANIQIRTLQDEYVTNPSRTGPRDFSRAAGMAEYPIIEPRARPEAPAAQRTERNSGKKKRPVVTKNDGFKLGFRFHIPFTSKTPKSKKEPRPDPPVIHVVNPPQHSTRPTVTYGRSQPFAEGPYQPYEQPRRPSFERRYNYTAYPAEPGRPAETHQSAQHYPAAASVLPQPFERSSRSRERRRTVDFQSVPTAPIPPPVEPRIPERPVTTIFIPEEREDTPPVFREHTSRPRGAVVITRSPSRERRSRARSSTPAPRIPFREHTGRRMPRAPTPPRRNHSPRRLRRIEEDIRRVETALRSARQQARVEDAERREQRLARVQRDLQTLYDQQDAEIELHHQLRVVRDDRAAFEARRRDRIPRDQARGVTLHQPPRQPRAERDITRDRNDFEDQGTRVINRAVTHRREERENRDRGNDRLDDRRVERRDGRHELRREGRRIERQDERRTERREERRVESRDGRREERREASAHRAQRDRNRSGNVQRRNTISGSDHFIWDDDRERRRRRWL